MKEQRGSMHSAMQKGTEIMGKPKLPAGSSPKDLLAQSNYGKQQRVLWIDGVGGYLLLQQEEVSIGQAVAGSDSDVRVVGDLSRQAAAIRRAGGDYLLQPLQPTQINGSLIDRPQLLSNQDVVTFGERVEMRFSLPNPLSATARLEMASLHRFKPSVDGVLLLSDSCVLGPSAGSHVSCPSWKDELLMFRHGEDWYFRTLAVVEVNGKEQRGQIRVEPGMRVQGADFSLSLE